MAENKMVAIYKHVSEEGLSFTVDPTTKELTSKPSKRLREFLKNAGPSTTVAQLITIGVFVKICDCIMEVKKVRKLVKSTQGHSSNFETKIIPIENCKYVSSVETLLHTLSTTW